MSNFKFYDEEEKFWSAPNAPSVINPSISIGHVILWSLHNNAKKILQISHDSNIELNGETIRVYTIRAAANLQTRGCELGDTISIIARNGPFVAPIVYAAFCIGCPVNSLDPSFTKVEIVHMISVTKPKAVFCDAGIFDVVRQCLDEIESEAMVFVFGGGEVEGATSVENLLEDTVEAKSFSVVELDGENTTAAIVCTSGSTGLSKGVCLSHACLINQASNIDARSYDVGFTFSTPFWISGFIMLLISAIKGFCRVITTQPFNPEMLLELIERYRITFVLSAAHLMVLTSKSDKFAESDLSSIRIILTAGSKLSAVTAVEISKRLTNGAIGEIYGMSEVGGGITLNIFLSDEDRSVGRLSHSIQAKILDDDGNRLGENECGDLCTKSKYPFLGYFNNEEATNDSIDDEGFLKTGDIGYFDSNGKLFLVDRKKDMMKYNASQISPTELEQFLIRSSRINAACVVGIPDPISGDLPAAVIVRNETEDPITQEEVEQMIAENFSDFKRLRGGVLFVDSLPLTASGKIIRRQVKKLAIEMYEYVNSGYVRIYSVASHAGAS